MEKCKQKLRSLAKDKKINNPPYYFPQYDDLNKNKPPEFDTALALARHAAIEFQGETGKALIWLKTMDLRLNVWNMARRKVCNASNPFYVIEKWPDRRSHIDEAIRDTLLNVWFPNILITPIVHWQHTWVLPWLSREMMGLESPRTEQKRREEYGLENNYVRNVDDFSRYKEGGAEAEKKVEVCPKIRAHEASTFERKFKACNLDEFENELLKKSQDQTDRTNQTKIEEDDEGKMMDLDLDDELSQQKVHRNEETEVQSDDALINEALCNLKKKKAPKKAKGGRQQIHVKQTSSDSSDYDESSWIPASYQNKYLIDTEESDEEFEFWRKQTKTENDMTVYNDLIDQLDDYEGKISGNKNLMSMLEGLLEEEVGTKKNLAIDDSDRYRKRKKKKERSQRPQRSHKSPSPNKSDKFEMFTDTSDEEESKDFFNPVLPNPRRFAIETPAPRRRHMAGVVQKIGSIMTPSKARREKKISVVSQGQQNMNIEGAIPEDTTIDSNVTDGINSTKLEKSGYELLTMKDLAMLTPMLGRRSIEPQPNRATKAPAQDVKIKAKVPSLTSARLQTHERSEPPKIVIGRNKPKLKPIQETKPDTKPIEYKTTKSKSSQARATVGLGDKTSHITTQNAYKDQLAKMQEKLKISRPKNFDKQVKTNSVKDNEQLDLVVKNLTKLKIVKTKELSSKSSVRLNNTNPNESNEFAVNNDEMAKSIKGVKLKKTKKSSFSNLENERKHSAQNRGRNEARIDFSSNLKKTGGSSSLRSKSQNKRLDSLKTYFKQTRTPSFEDVGTEV